MANLCSVTFQGTLRPEQKAAADSMLGHETGVLAATTAFGKTVVAAWLIAAARRQHTRACASTAVAGSMGGATVDVSEHQQP